MCVCCLHWRINVFIFILTLHYITLYLYLVIVLCSRIYIYADICIYAADRVYISVILQLSGVDEYVTLRDARQTHEV